MYIMKARGGGQLKEHLLSNDEEFLRIYNNNKNTVFGIAFNYTKSNSDANDILQDVFVKFFISKKVFNGDERIKAWLIRVTINACKKHLLSAWTRKTVPLDESIPFVDRESSELFESVMFLPKHYRMVIHLFYYEGYSISEIASILRIKESTVKVRLMRARNILRDRLKEVWLDE